MENSDVATLLSDRCAKFVHGNLKIKDHRDMRHGTWDMRHGMHSRMSLR